MVNKRAIALEGAQDVIQAFKVMTSAMDPKDVAKVMLAGARVIRKDMRRRAPRGPTGNLKKAMRSKISKRLRKTNPSAWAAVDRKKAPHAHLVEFGTVHSAPHPFIRPAVEGTKGEVAKVLAKGLAEGVQAVARRAAKKGTKGGRKKK